MSPIFTTCTVQVLLCLPVSAPRRPKKNLLTSTVPGTVGQTNLGGLIVSRARRPSKAALTESERELKLPILVFLFCCLGTILACGQVLWCFVCQPGFECEQRSGLCQDLWKRDASSCSDAQYRSLCCQRDSMTVFASFNVAPVLAKSLVGAEVAGARTIAQLFCPVVTQWLQPI